MFRLRNPFRPAAARCLVVGVVAAAFAAPASASAGVFDSLSGWWPMYEGSGQTIHDLSGNGNHGQLGSTPGADANDPTWIRGFLFGSALRFDGNDFVRIQDDSSLNTPKVTVSAWIRGSASPGINRYIISKGANPCESSAYALYTAEGGLRFYYQDAVDPTLLHSSGIAAPASIWNGKWHHVAGTWDGTTPRLFVDGKLVPLVGSPDVHLGAPTTSGDLGIGDFLGTCDLYYTGDVDQVALFSQALPVDQIWSKVTALFSRPMR